MRRRLPAYALSVLTLAACGGGETESAPPPPPPAGPPLPWAPAAVPSAPAPKDNPTTKEKIELGRLLFYDPILSSDQLTACATCHSEEWGMADGLARSIGVDGMGPTGPGRTGPNVLRRNAQTLWNAAYRTSLFWDGRADSLEAQVLFPLKEEKELGRDPAAVVADLSAIPEYVSLFESAFGDAAPAVTVENMQRAIAAFERSLVTDRSPYDHYVSGDEGALSADAKKGMFLFGEVGCAKCHVPPLFESSTFADRAVPPIDGIADDGRAEVTKDAADARAFRVPTLRNIRETGPYFHTGAVATLDDAVRHEAGLASRALSDDEVAALVTFLNKGLIDPSRSPGRPDTVPSGLPVPLDGFRIPR
jgi:cytochrome c peroxidase